MSPRARRRVCGLCGQPFVILVPDGAQEPERDKLCGVCAMLPAGRRSQSQGRTVRSTLFVVRRTALGVSAPAHAPAKPDAIRR